MTPSTPGAGHSGPRCRRQLDGIAQSSCADSEPTNAMRNILVAPGVPSGTPATMMTRWPALEKPSLKARRHARWTMSSWSWASSATTQWTPHTSDSLRPVRMDDGAIERIALHLLGDAIHGRDRLDRKLPGRRFGRQHDRIGTFENCR